MSAPMVAGTIGLMFAINPSLNPAEIKDILKCSFYDINSRQPLEYRSGLGTGRLNAFKAVKIASTFLSAIVTSILNKPYLF